MSNRSQNTGERYCVGDMEILNSVKLTDEVTLFLARGDVRHAVVNIIVFETNERLERARNNIERGNLISMRNGH